MIDLQEDSIEYMDIDDIETLTALNSAIVELRTQYVDQTKTAIKVSSEPSIKAPSKAQSETQIAANADSDCTYVKSPSSSPLINQLDREVLEEAKAVVVLDTNYFLTGLRLLKELEEISLENKVVLIIPWIVIQELDGLKNKNTYNTDQDGKKVLVSSAVRNASRFIESRLGRPSSSLRGQKRNEIIGKPSCNDDKILDCCIYFMEHWRLPVAILSKDRNMNIKARIHGCITCDSSLKDPKVLISAIKQSSPSNTGSLHQADYDVCALQTAAPPPTKYGDIGSSSMDVEMEVDSDYEGRDYALEIASTRSPRNHERNSSTDHSSKPENENTEVFVLDEASLQHKHKIRLQVSQATAEMVSCRVVSYICSDNCSLQQVLKRRLSRTLNRETTSGEDWVSILKKNFDPSPWRSTTVILTVIWYYWSTFSQLFPRDMKQRIIEVLPWVMFVEGFEKCPQTTMPLPYHYTVKQYSFNIDHYELAYEMNKAEKDALIAKDYKLQTISLIRVVRSVLAQCELFESEEQSRIRCDFIEQCTAWFDINK